MECSAAAIRWLAVEQKPPHGIVVVMRTSGGFNPAAFNACLVRLLTPGETAVCGRLHLLPVEVPRNLEFSYRFEPSKGQKPERVRFYPGLNPWSNVVTVELLIEGRAVRKANTYDNARRA
jgi:hypothetical protein